MIDPSTATGALILNILAGIGLAATLAIFSWFLGPLKWPIQSRRIRKIILRNRGFLFFFNPEGNQKKIITFLANGQIDEGRNNNENTWQIKRGRLEILAVDGEIYSRFKYEQDTGKLIHTNDPDTRSVHGQFFVPQWERPDYG
ncbi:MAG TPA: hypothetical protein ENH94_09085 [Phycisphaerales bacterium]|nr:hypothetical protein [Phycisphaerales bacterium]